jgi:hypothetical protein
MKDLFHRIFAELLQMKLFSIGKNPGFKWKNKEIAFLLPFCMLKGKMSWNKEKPDKKIHKTKKKPENVLIEKQRLKATIKTILISCQIMKNNKSSRTDISQNCH